MMPMRASPVTALELLTLCFGPAGAEDVFENDSSVALRILYGSEPVAKLIGGKSKAVLVFPSIAKAGITIGGQYGEGVLLANGRRVARYRSVAASYGLQARVQSFSYALFFMNAHALQYLDIIDGWEIGAGPSIVTVDKGIAESLSATTLKDDVYAFVFNRKGLAAGLGIQGSKITKLEK